MKMVSILANRDYRKEIAEIFDKERDKILEYYDKYYANLNEEDKNKYGSDIISFINLHIHFSDKYLETSINNIKADNDTSSNFLTETQNKSILKSPRLELTFNKEEKFIKVNEISMQDHKSYTYCITKKKRNLKKAWDEIIAIFNNRTSLRKVLEILRKYELIDKY